MKKIHNVTLTDFEYFSWKIKQCEIWPEDWEEIVFDNELSDLDKMELIRLANESDV